MENSTRFGGRMLFLSCAPEKVAAQIGGHNLSLAASLPLRDNVSTDEITPTTVMLIYDKRLGRNAYVGYTAGESQPIATDAIINGGFEVTVAGKRYGKGSSRESSPLAEKYAGIRLIVAESFENIYRQNCDNIGILTTTDFSVLEQIAAGEPIPLDFFLEGRDTLTRDIIRSGGLLRYGTLHLPKVRGKYIAVREPSNRPLTLVEKIIARRRVVPDHDPGQGEGVVLSADWRFSHDYFTGMCAHFLSEEFGDNIVLERPDEIIAFQDHLVLAHQSRPHVTGNMLPAVQDLFEGHFGFVTKFGVRSHGLLANESGSEGICHALMAEKYALPGEIVVGTDSHTPHVGAVGALAFGAGATAIANSWLTGLIRLKMPEVIRVQIDGALGKGLAARDIVQYLLQTQMVRTGQAIGAVFEYGGPAVKTMSTDERATLTNMVAEMGGLTGIVEPDEETVAFIRERRGVDVVIEEWMHSDPGAHYKHVIHCDCEDLLPMVAQPGDPGSSIRLAELTQRVAVDIAYGGSCTAGKREDFDMYHEVLKWGLDHGMRVAGSTQLFLQFGTLAVREYCRQRGYLDTFEKVGVHMVSPGCGACANCGPGQSSSKDQVTISSINRNFPGRSGPGKVWLGSPYTVAASALVGYITSFQSMQEKCSKVKAATFVGTL
jgi:3-isopropylmalate/(R)-2-methylmalate dehydratase large subunit